MSRVAKDMLHYTRGWVDVLGFPGRRWSKCHLCGLDSGPWLTKFQATASGMLHLSVHHPDYYL